MGYDFEEETLARKQNDDFQAKHGVVVADAAVADAVARGDKQSPNGKA